MKSGPKIKPLKERFYKHVFYASNGCHEWTAYIDRDGYGHINDGIHASAIAHRTAYEFSHSKIPAGLSIDHLCRNRKCVNPEHLEAVSMRINVLRGNTLPAKNYLKTACNRGHLFDRKNTHINTRGQRVCRACCREKESKKRKKLKMEVLYAKSSLERSERQRQHRVQ